METVQINLDKRVFDNATAYARLKGIDVSSLVEGYLSRITHSRSVTNEPVPDVVLSLLGAGEPVDEDDVNARAAFYSHMENKHK
jgi:prophage tail gpP-like protein